MKNAFDCEILITSWPAFGHGPLEVNFRDVTNWGEPTCKVTEGVSGQQGISGHGPSFRSLGAVFANNCTALESLKVGHACALIIIRKNC